MDWARGLRAALALCIPLIAAYLTGYAPLGWTALGGFEAVISDGGGAYRSRLGRLALLSLGGGLGCFLGTLAGGDLRWAVPVTALFCFAWSYLSVLGQPWLSSGLLIQVIFVCGLGAPSASVGEASLRGLLVLAGGVWAISFSLILWPFDPFRPARAGAGQCFAALAAFLAAIHDLRASPQSRPADWHRLATHHQNRLRKLLEDAWHSVASVRAESLGESNQGTSLIVLLETADLLLARTIALAEHLEGGGLPAGADPGSLALLAVSDLRETEQRIAADLIGKPGRFGGWGGMGRSSAVAMDGLDRRAQLESLARSLRDCLGAAGNDSGNDRGNDSGDDSGDRFGNHSGEALPLPCVDDPESADYRVDRFLLSQLAESLSLAETAVECVLALRLGASASLAGDLTLPAWGKQTRDRLAEYRRRWRLERFDPIRAHLRRDSLFLRHAVRVALVCSLDVMLIRLLNVDHGYWLLMTSLIVLQPSVGGTMRRGLERTIGTVCGGVLAAFLAIALHSPMATALALFPLAVLCLAILPVSYAAYAFFLTPTFVLAYLPHPGDWQLAWIRVGDTATGAAIALGAMRLLFPSFERDRIAHYLLASLDANRRYLDLLAQSWSEGLPSTRPLAQARRAAGLAHNDTEESLERVLSESWSRKGSVAEAALTVATYLRRFAQSITTLTTLEGAWGWKASPAVAAHLQRLSARLRSIQQQISSSEGEADEPGGLAPAEPPGESETGIAMDTTKHITMGKTVEQNSTPGSLPELELAEMGERQLHRLDRQAAVLSWQLETIRRHNWLPSL